MTWSSVWWLLQHFLLIYLFLTTEMTKMRSAKPLVFWQEDLRTLAPFLNPENKLKSGADEKQRGVNLQQRRSESSAARESEIIDHTWLTAVFVPSTCFYWNFLNIVKGFPARGSNLWPLLFKTNVKWLWSVSILIDLWSIKRRLLWWKLPETSHDYSVGGEGEQNAPQTLNLQISLLRMKNIYRCFLSWLKFIT